MRLFERRSTTDDGALRVVFQPIAGYVDGVRHQGWLMDSTGACCITTSPFRDGDYRYQGARFSKEGAMYVTGSTVYGAGDFVHESVRFTSDGEMYLQSASTSLNSALSGIRRNNASAIYASVPYTATVNGIAAAFSTPPTETRKMRIQQVVDKLTADGVWAKLDLFYMLAAADSQAASINWAAVASNTLSATNSPTFTADRGYTGDGASSYVSATYTNTNYTSTDAFIALVNLNSTALGAVQDASIANSGGFTRGLVSARNAGRSMRASSGAGTVFVATANNPAMTAGGRGPADSSNQSTYLNGVFDTTGAAAGSNVGAGGNVNICAAPAFPSFSDRQQAFFACGGYLTAAQHKSLYDAVWFYLQGVGAVA